MALRDKMIETSQPFLKPGEQIHAVIGAQTGNPHLAAFNMWYRFAVNRFRIVVATNERILVLDAGRWSWKKARGVVAELPRSIRLGPATGLWYSLPLDGLTGRKLRVPRIFFKEITAADAGLPVA